jgi:hypothetical protein
MRTTLTIDDDVLSAAKELAEQERKTVGEVISSLARQAMRPPVATFSHTRSGIPLLPVRPDAKPVTLELVNRLRDELP